MKSRAESPIWFPYLLPLLGLSSPETGGWNLRSWQGTNVVFHPKKAGNLGAGKGVSQDSLARSLATSGFIPIPKSSPPRLHLLPPLHSHHLYHCITITIITYSIVNAGVGHCAEWFTYIVSFSSHNHTPWHSGTWSLEKAHDLCRDTAGQVVELEIEQVSLNTKPLPSISMPYAVSLVLK